MKAMKQLRTLIATTALALLGAACGQLDGQDRAVVYDVRADAIVALHTDFAVTEEDAVELAKTIRLVDANLAAPGDDLRNRLDPNGALWVEVEARLIPLVPVPPLRTSGDHKAFQTLIRKYPMLEQAVVQLPL